jgi:hypothetical protein
LNTVCIEVQAADDESPELFMDMMKLIFPRLDFDPVYIFKVDSSPTYIIYFTVSG